MISLLFTILNLNASSFHIVLQLCWKKRNIHKRSKKKRNTPVLNRTCKKKVWTLSNLPINNRNVSCLNPRADLALLFCQQDLKKGLCYSIKTNVCTCYRDIFQDCVCLQNMLYSANIFKYCVETNKKKYNLAWQKNESL